jgi:hypothetical protein
MFFDIGLMSHEAFIPLVQEIFDFQIAALAKRFDVVTLAAPNVGKDEAIPLGIGELPDFVDLSSARHQKPY